MRRVEGVVGAIEPELAEAGATEACDHSGELFIEVRRETHGVPPVGEARRVAHLPRAESGGDQR